MVSPLRWWISAPLASYDYRVTLLGVAFNRAGLVKQNSKANRSLKIYPFPRFCTLISVCHPSLSAFSYGSFLRTSVESNIYVKANGGRELEVKMFSYGASWQFTGLLGFRLRIQEVRIINMDFFKQHREKPVTREHRVVLMPQY